MNPINRKGLAILLFGALIVSTALTGIFIFNMNATLSRTLLGTGAVLFVYGLFLVLKSRPRK